MLIYAILFILGAFLGGLSQSNGSGHDPLKSLWIQSVLLTLSIVGAQIACVALGLFEMPPPPPLWFRLFGTWWTAYLLSGLINHMWLKKNWKQ